MATSSFYLKVISANRVFFAGKCRSLIVPEFDGQKEILAHHEDMVIAIDEGQMKFQPEGSDEWIHAVVGMGFVEIVNNRVTLLVETAEKPEEIDVRRAEEAKQRAEERLRQKQSIHEYYHSRAALARAMARLKATSGKQNNTNVYMIYTDKHLSEHLQGCVLAGAFCRAGIMVSHGVVDWTLKQREGALKSKREAKARRIGR